MTNFNKLSSIPMSKRWSSNN